MAYASIKDALEAKRADYDKELEWHQFLLDSYTGGGGYQGRVKQDAAGFWGIAAQTYSKFVSFVKGIADAKKDSYLDGFNAEDSIKFGRRKDVAHYLNYVEPTTAIKVGYICRKQNKRNNVPPKLLEWMEKTGYDKEFRRRALVTAVLGWFPMLVDMPAAKDGALTAQQAGSMDPYVVLSLPCHLLDYELDERGKFLWAKMAVAFERKGAWDAELEKVTRYTVWTATDFTVYEVTGEKGTEDVGKPRTGPHSFGQVPIVSWRADVSVEDSVKAKSINANIALECRRLFNLISEMDEHIRCQVFAQMIWPGSAPGGNESGTGGVSTGLVIGAEQKNLPFYLAPPASVAATLEARILATIQEIYRIAGVEYAKASGVQSSAQSKENEFEKTNVGIAALAQALARADRDTLILVGRALGIPEAELQKIEVTAHESYADAALGDELAQAMDALTMQIGRQARVEILQRLVQKLLPGLAADTIKIILLEIEKEVDQAEKDKEALKKASLEAVDGDDPDDPEADAKKAQIDDQADHPSKPADEGQGIDSEAA